ncbi:MAG: biopolymer transporter ExbD [Planctomycetaceae bacterium]|nr:biopolymer transporter ExbD [Planctomycetaceae bacterium]
MKQGMFDTGSTRKQRYDSDADLDITPMIDVTFLLLIFFMVTSTMQSTPEIDLPLAQHGAGINKSEQVTVSVIDLNGIPVLTAGDPSAPEMDMDEILEYVRVEIDAGKSGILVKASGSIPTGYIKQLTQKLQSVGEVRFYYAVSEK